MRYIESIIRYRLPVVMTLAYVVYSTSYAKIEMEVPRELIGMTQGDATVLLEKANFRVQTKYGSFCTNRGTVVATEPKPGSKIAVADESEMPIVEIVVDSQTGINVPSIVGQTFLVASRTLGSVNLKLHKDHSRVSKGVVGGDCQCGCTFSETHRDNTIYAQDPKSDSLICEGKTVIGTIRIHGYDVGWPKEKICP